MIRDNVKTLSISICIVLLLLCVCMTIDYADEDIITNINNTSNISIPENAIVVNNSSAIILDKNAGIIVTKSSDKIYNKYPIVSMWARPSVRCNLPYKWYYRSFIDYCPHCKRYNVLYNAHKWPARFENEWTCKRCGADYDAVIGKEKYSWSNYYLRKA